MERSASLFGRSAYWDPAPFAGETPSNVAHRRLMTSPARPASPGGGSLPLSRKIVQPRFEEVRIEQRSSYPTLAAPSGGGGVAPVAGAMSLATRDVGVAPGASIIQRQETAAAPGKVANLHLFTDVDVKELGLDELKQGAVGHTWVSLEYKDPSKVPGTVHSTHRPLLQNPGKYADPMGFWPKIWYDAQENRQGGYSTNLFKSYVPGEMRHPDRAHEGSEKASQSWELTQTEADSVIGYAESKRNADYSVYFFNCTTFAKEAVEASGKSPPSMGTLGIAFPNAAYDGIKQRQEEGIGNTSVTDLDTGNVTTVDNPDDKKQKK